MNTPILIAALSLLAGALAIVALYYYLTRAKRAARKARRQQASQGSTAAIKAVAKTYLQSLNDHATQLTSTKLSAVPGRPAKGVSAFYLYFTYRDLTRNEAHEDLIRVTIKRTRHRGAAKVEEIIVTAPITRDKAKLINKIKAL